MRLVRNLSRKGRLPRSPYSFGCSRVIRVYDACEGEQRAGLLGFRAALARPGLSVVETGLRRAQAVQWR